MNEKGGAKQTEQVQQFVGTTMKMKPHKLSHTHTLTQPHYTHITRTQRERERERETEKRAHSTPGSRDGSGQSAKHIDCKREEKHQKRHFTSSKEVIDAVFVPSWINT